MTLQGMMGMPMQQPVGVAGGVAAGGAMAANPSQQPKQVPQPKSKKVLLQCFTRIVLHPYSAVILVQCYIVVHVAMLCLQVYFMCLLCLRMLCKLHVPYIDLLNVHLFRYLYNCFIFVCILLSFGLYLYM